MVRVVAREDRKIYGPNAKEAKFFSYKIKLLCLTEGKETGHSAGSVSCIPGSGRSPGEGNGNPLQYSCLENPMDGGA